MSLIVGAVLVAVVAVTGIVLAVAHHFGGSAAGTSSGSARAAPSAGASTAAAGSAPAKSSPAASAARSPAAGVPVTGVWKGTYTCNQGLTGVQLTITGSSADAVMATVDFYPVASNPGTASGSYEMVGRYSAAGGLVLNPDYWIDQPAGYAMVGLSAPPPGGNSMRGTVQGDGCTTFSVRR